MSALILMEIRIRCWWCF